MAIDDINVPKGKSAPILDTQQSYVFDNVEVTKTGRVAEKTLTSGKKDTQYEVSPKHQSNGIWKKWVREQDLYEIKNN